VRTIALTQTGAQLHAAAQRDIHAIEDQLLNALETTEQHALHAALIRLDQPPDASV